MPGYGYGQFGKGPFNKAVISRQFVGSLSTLVGQRSQLAIVDTYSDGTESALEGKTWSSSDPTVALITSSGMIQGLKPGTVTITMTDPNNGFAVIGYTPFTVTAGNIGTLPTPTAITIPNFQSHLTQVLQNYFDWKDTRIRQGKYTIDSQFLNISAQQIQLSSLRLARELGATVLNTCPSNIDNKGCYFKQQLPDSFNYNLPVHSIVGIRNNSYIALTPYKDELPVPSYIDLSQDYSPIPLSNATLFSALGIGLNSPQSQNWACQRFGPFTLAFSNRIHFWLDGPVYSTVNITVKIVGQKAPAPVWSDENVESTETIVVNNLGWFVSKFAWDSITTIQILNLPVGMTLAAYEGTFVLPQQPDLIRPHAESMYRDVSFDRYWSVGNLGLIEQYMKSNSDGWEYIQSYETDFPVSAIAVEPNTWGGFAASGSTLFYFDRREPLPSQAALVSTALIQEPYFGLHITIDPNNLYPIYYITLNPIAYGSATQATSYRYLVQTPDGNQYVITPDGLFATYTPSAGWRAGTPTVPLNIPLGENGTYIFTLQTSGSLGPLYDSVVWQKLEFKPLATFDLSSIVPQIEGLYFDDRNMLWAWTGTYVVPLQIHYDGYVIDQTSNSVYLTDLVDGLILDGVVV